MRRWVFRIIVVVVVLGALGWGYQFYSQRNQAAQTAAQEEAAVVEDELANVIWASGELEPVNWAALSASTGGTIAQIHVAEGEWVKVDQVLVELENAALHSQVLIAEAGLAEAEAALAQLQAGATEHEIAAAEAAVSAAEANVSLAAGQMIETQSLIDAAAVGVNLARLEYNELASHPTEAERTAAQAELAIAQSVVSQAQAAYNVVRGDPQIGSRPESMALAEATAGLEAAQAKATLATQGPSAQQLALANGRISAAQVDLGAAQGRAPGAEANVLSAMAQQASAQAALDALLAGATTEEVAMAEARVQVGRARLQQAQAQLRQSQIVAPFAGWVGRVDRHMGETVVMGEPIVTFGDTAAMHVRTTDLRETDVVHVTPEMPVEVTFDALPDTSFTGTVERITPVSSSAQGSTNYTVYIDVAELDEQLRWGMTAFVNIEPTQ